VVAKEVRRCGRSSGSSHSLLKTFYFRFFGTLEGLSDLNNALLPSSDLKASSISICGSIILITFFGVAPLYLYPGLSGAGSKKEARPHGEKPSELGSL